MEQKCNKNLLCINQKTQGFIAEMVVVHLLANWLSFTNNADVLEGIQPKQAQANQKHNKNLLHIDQKTQGFITELVVVHLL
eukprot:4801027-Ditylum_brightwellii.AAC.1